jgi:hypothetical protein
MLREAIDKVERSFADTEDLRRAILLAAAYELIERHARTIKRPAQAKVARQMPNQKYRQKPFTSRTVVKTAATYESTPVKVAQDNFARIAVSVCSEHRKVRSCAGGRVIVFVFMGEP